MFFCHSESESEVRLSKKLSVTNIISKGNLSLFDVTKKPLDIVVPPRATHLLSTFSRLQVSTMAAKGECTSEIGAFTLDGKGLVSGRVTPCHLEVCLRYWDNTQLGQFRARSQAINDPDREPITNKLGTSGNSQGMGSLVFFSFFWMS